MITLREESNGLACWIQIKWQMMDSLFCYENLLHFCDCESLTNYIIIMKKNFSILSIQFWRNWQKGQTCETTYWYFHISIVSLHKKTTQLLRPMFASTVHFTEDLFMI